MMTDTNSPAPHLPPGVSVIVPVYGSASILPALVHRMEPVLKQTNENFELILVNDGSPDNSETVITQLAQQHSWIRGISLMRNYGQHNALLAGIRIARFAIAVTMDDDLQHPPEEIPRLIAALSSEIDVAYGTPLQEQHGILRDLASIITKIALKSAIGVREARSVSSWRVFRTSLRDAFARYSSPFVSIDVLLSWGTRRFGAVKLNHERRLDGRSNYTFGQLLQHAVNMMTGYSVLPLQFASLIGFLFTLFGLGVLTYVLIVYFLSDDSVSGFPFLASIISIFAGAQLFAIGIIGEYLARMHFRTMDKPSYTIRSQIN